MDEELRKEKRRQWEEQQKQKAAQQNEASSSTAAPSSSSSTSAGYGSSSAPVAAESAASSSSSSSQAAQKAEAAAPPPVVGSARERRHTENPVDVVVSVPRALTTEEMFEQQAEASSAPAGVLPNARRVHILPVGSSPVEDHRRLELLAPTLRSMRDSKVIVRTGLFMNASNQEFVVVKSEPDEALLVAETDYFVEGLAIQRFEKVQFICLWDFEHCKDGQEASALFNEYISPHFRKRNSSGQAGSVCSVGEIMKINGLEFQVMAAEPTPPDLGIIDTNTMVFVDWDSTPEFSRIHIVPFQDTLPAADRKSVV